MTRREVLVGVTGGVAAFKTAALVSQLVQDGYGVTVAMTDAATRFVGAATFAALTGRQVAQASFDAQHPLGAHITLVEHADAFVVAPATANFIGKIAHGIADDLLTTLYLSCARPVLVAPAMNHHMWSKPSVQRNVQTLAADGVRIVSPQSGWLSCRQKGVGRMAEPAAILAEIEAVLDVHGRGDE